MGSKLNSFITGIAEAQAMGSGDTIRNPPCQDRRVRSVCLVGASLRLWPWRPWPENATQRPLEVFHECVGAKRSTGAFMLAQPLRFLGSGAFAEKR